jgi:citrate lyase beta subunit
VVWGRSRGVRRVARTDEHILPKTEKPQDLLDVDQALAGTSIGVQALIETPGVQNVDEITRAEERLRSVIIGYADLGAGLGCSRTALPENWLAVQDGSRKQRLRGDERHVIHARMPGCHKRFG